MRSILLALVLAAPVSAVASMPNYSDVVTAMHHQRAEVVPITFVNFTMQHREIRIGNMQYKLRYDSQMQMCVPVGSVVREYSDQNSKINGLVLMQISTSDRGKSFRLK